MKKILYNIQKSLLAIAGLFFLGACESLDQNPHESLSTKLTFKTIKDGITWRNGFYASMREISYGDNYMLADVQSDMLNVTLLGTGGNYTPLHNWTFDPNHANISNIWYKRYNAIAVLNECIERFPSIEAKEDYEKATVKYLLAEAYAMRAYHFSQLVERFSPAYTSTNKSVAGLGIPLTLQYDVTAKPNRSSLEDTYNQILSDIERAENLFNEDDVRHQAFRVTEDEDFILYGNLGAISFTQNALTALKARVLLNKQDYAGAFAEAEKLINDTDDIYVLGKTYDFLKNIWHNDATSETIMQVTAINPTELAPSNDIYLQWQRKEKITRTGSDEDIFAPSYVPSQWVIDLYETNDHRRRVYFLENANLVANGRFYKSTLINKYPGNPSLSAGQRNYAHKPKIFRIAEAYLIAAESAYHTGDVANAQHYLNQLREARGISEVTSTGSDLFEDIKNERIREFAFEGMRLNDLKRWGEVLVRTAPQSYEYLVVSPAEQYINLRKPANDNKLVWPIPTNDIRHNPNITQNAGY